jgi:hypothetical protein
MSSFAKMIAASYASFVTFSTAVHAAAPSVATRSVLSGPYVVWNVSISVLSAAAFGAGLSLFFGDPIETRRSLYGQTISATVFGIAVGKLAAEGFNWTWASSNMELFALMSAAITRWFLPDVLSRITVLIKEFRLPSRRNNYSSDSSGDDSSDSSKKSDDKSSDKSDDNNDEVRPP